MFKTTNRVLSLSDKKENQTVALMLNTEDERLTEYTKVAELLKDYCTSVFTIKN